LENGLASRKVRKKMSYDVELFAFHIDGKLNPTQWDFLFSFLSEEKKKRVGAFLRYEDALRTLIADGIIRFIIHEKLGLNHQHIFFTTNTYGKPFLQDHPDFHFNLSHASDWVVCVIGTQAVGIDVERIQPIDLQIAYRYFSKEEIQWLDTAEENEKLEIFYEIWTMKESYIKAVGQGLSMSLDSFSVHPCLRLHPVQSQGDTKFFIKKYALDPLYKLSVCCSVQAFPMDIKLITVDDLIQSMDKGAQWYES
jgi:4'-phosphopantetheinyl transferase